MIVRDGVDGDVASKTITTPWKDETAQTSHDWDLAAHMTGTEETDTYTALEDGGFRQSRTVNSLDAVRVRLQQGRAHRHHPEG